LHTVARRPANHHASAKLRWRKRSETPAAAQSTLRWSAVMPIFEYACRQCGHAFEALVRSSTVPSCPQCQATQLDKQLSVVGKVGASGLARDFAPAAIGACGSCGHPDGPGACARQ
jgi:putative FmdB family regulatory protein